MSPKVDIANTIPIPLVDDFVNLKTIVQQITAIIEKIDFINSDEKVMLIELCNDAIYFLESKKPKLFILYVSHALRELTEKFFGEAKSVGEDAFFNFDEEVQIEMLDTLDDESYKFVERRDNRQVKLKKFIEEDERNSLLRASIDEVWHQNIWKLNNTYANNGRSKRDLGTKQFYKIIPAKYSISSWTYEELVKTRKALYRGLSGYAHGNKLKKIVEVLEKDPNERSVADNQIIEKYLEVNMSVIDIFRPFESTTNDKIKRIDELLNETK